MNKKSNTKIISCSKKIFLFNFSMANLLFHIKTSMSLLTLTKTCNKDKYSPVEGGWMSTCSILTPPVSRELFWIEL